MNHSYIKYIMRKYFLYIILGLLLVSCQDDNFSDIGNQDTNTTEEPSSIPGMQSVKLQSQIIKTIDNKAGELSIPTGNPQLDEYLNSIGAYKMQRIFPYAGKSEDLQISEGLNAWYTVWYNESKTNVKSSVSTSIFDFVEPVYHPVIGDYTVSAVQNPSTKSLSQISFNDPGFSRQWNMYNEGKVGNYQLGSEAIISSIAGADINILPAWAEESGNPNVVVAVVDGGIDIYHEDLIDNLWINKGEIPGNGIDDDNNGFIDDVYGYNFVNGTGIIEPHDHGTHVAGVIAAKNNNGKGICGIAGGDGSANSGVRLMSCQMFMTNPNYDPNDPDSSSNISTTTNQTAAAIVYGANNGAVISQNSWGYDIGISTPQVVKEAIAYFTKHAGESTNSQMKGGLVVFAASNDYTEFKAYPAAEADVVSVAAYAPDFSATWYTNYGDWVDIAAPGGTQKIGQKYPYEGGEMTSGIYSTIVSKNGQSRYGYMQGTSMACPHVSGIAALIVSKYGGDNFTVSELRQRLLTGVKKINPNNYNTEKYHNKLGRGYIDAQIALSDYDNNIVPADPAFIPDQTERSYSSISLAWKSTADINDGSIQSYILYFSDKEITSSNYLNTDVSQIEVTASFTSPNDILKRSLKSLKSGKTYYFAIQTFSRSGNSSNLVIYQGGISTLTNIPPVISSSIDLNNTIALAGNDVQEIIFEINDKENHAWTYNITYKEQLFTEQSGNTIRIRIFANKFASGTHTIQLAVTDEYGASSSVKLNVKIENDNPPRLVNNISSINVHIDSPKTISLRNLIEDEDKSSLTFALGILKNENARVSLLNDQLTITPKKIGETELSFSVTDKHNQKSELTLPIFIYQNEGIYSLYPTSVSQTVYVKLGDIINGDIQLKIRNIMGKLALEKTYNTNSIDSQKRTLLVNVGSLFPGKYELSIINNGKTYKESFVKE